MQRRWIAACAALMLLSLTQCGPDDPERFTCSGGSCQYCNDDGCFDASWHSDCASSASCQSAQLCVQGGCCWTCEQDRDCPGQQTCRSEGYCAEDGWSGNSDTTHQPGCTLGESCEQTPDGGTDPAQGGSDGGAGGGGAAGPPSDCGWQPPLPTSCLYNSECPEGYLCSHRACIVAE